MGFDEIRGVSCIRTVQWREKGIFARLVWRVCIDSGLQWSRVHRLHRSLKIHCNEKANPTQSALAWLIRLKVITWHVWVCVASRVWCDRTGFSSFFFYLVPFSQPQLPPAWLEEEQQEHTWHCVGSLEPSRTSQLFNAFCPLNNEGRRIVVLLLSYIHTWWLVCMVWYEWVGSFSLYIQFMSHCLYVLASLMSILTRSLILENSHAHSFIISLSHRWRWKGNI